MIILNPRKWDIIGKLKWLVLTFLAVIILSSPPEQSSSPPLFSG